MPLAPVAEGATRRCPSVIVPGEYGRGPELRPEHRPVITTGATRPPERDAETSLTMEYLVTMTTRVPHGTPEEAVQDIRTRETAHSRDVAARGHLLRLWRPPLQPGEWRTLGLFAAADGGRLEEVLASMPLRVWRTDEVTPLSPHPNDPLGTQIIRLRDGRREGSRRHRVTRRADATIGLPWPHR